MNLRANGRIDEKRPISLAKDIIALFESTDHKSQKT